MLMTTPYNGAQKNLMKVCVIHKKWLNSMILVLNQEKSNFHNTIRLKQTSIVNNKLSKKQLEKTFKNQNCNALFRASQYNEPGTAQIIDIFELTCIERVLLAFQTTYPKKIMCDIARIFHKPPTIFFNQQDFWVSTYTQMIVQKLLFSTTKETYFIYISFQPQKFFFPQLPQ